MIDHRVSKKLDRLYIRVDAHFPDDEKYQALPYKLRDSAYLFFEALNGWSRDKKTDGRVPMHMAHAIGRKMEHPAHKITTFLAALAATDVQLLELRPEEVFILKYRKWQDTAEEIERYSQAGRAGGQASGRARGGTVAERSANESFSDPSTNRSASGRRSVNDRSSQTETETETETETVTRLRPVTPPDPPPKQSFGEVLTGEFVEGYEAFLAAVRRSTGRSFRGDALSRALYADRRRDGRSDADLEAAGRGVALSAHHMGLNKLKVPLNDPKHILESAMLDTLIGLGKGEIGVTREETGDERRDREWDEALRRRGELPPGLHA